MGWVLLIIGAIGTLFVGFRSLTSNKPDEPHYSDAVTPSGPDTPEEDLAEGTLDVEEYEAQKQPVTSTHKNLYT